MGTNNKIPKNDKNATKKIQKLIQSIRNHGKTQPKIADETGIHQAIISQLSLGKYNANLDKHYTTLNDYAETIGVNIEGIEKEKIETILEDPYKDWLLESCDKLEIENPMQLSKIVEPGYLTLLNYWNGDSSIQEVTKKKIIKSLKEYASKKNTKISDPPQTIQKVDAKDGVKIFETFLLEYNEQNIKDAPESVGIYMIHDKRGLPTYIGIAHSEDSKGIQGRIKEHKEKKSFNDENSKYVSYFHFQSNSNDKLTLTSKNFLEIIEKIAIKFSGNANLLNTNHRLKVPID